MSVDVLIAGGGLAGSLAAWRLAVTRPDVSVHVYESGATLGGNHTWSFHATDVSPDELAWLAPLITHRWPEHRVTFPGGDRLLAGEYCTITSARLDRVVGEALGDRVTRAASIDTVGVDHVRLATGGRLEADVVIDARGAATMPCPSGWQTFLGQDIECRSPHGVQTPIVMDATVPQVDAFRFMYVLPWSPTHVLVEHTAYADDPTIDAAAYRRAIDAYVAAQGWAVAHVLREEVGCLPVPLAGEIARFWPDGVIRLGMRAGLFHPTTGYSLPDAVATVSRLTTLNPFDAASVYREVRALAERRWRERAFYRLLNRWLFRAAAPEARVHVLEQFYQRPTDLIARFYAGRLTIGDRVRLLTGRPPVPIWRAVANLWP